MRECGRCGAGMDVDMATICYACTGRLRGHLERVGTLTAELDITLTRVARVRISNGPGGSEIDPVRMPFHVGASQAKEDARALLNSWTQLVLDQNQTASWTGPSDPGIRAYAAFLSQHVPWLRRHYAAPELCDELGAVVGRIARVIDSQPEIRFVGDCTSCGYPLWASSDSWTVTCRTCGTDHEAWDIQSSWLKRAPDALATAATISRAFSTVAEPITPDRIRKWRDRGHLEAAACDVRTRRELYRLGDVAETLKERRQR